MTQSDFYEYIETIAKLDTEFPSAVQLMVRQHEGDHGRDYSEEFLRS